MTHSSKTVGRGRIARWTRLAALLGLAVSAAVGCAEEPRERAVAPLLEFPEPPLDDPAAYQGYATRFFQDVHGNAFQVYLKRREGRIVHVWADAANESVGFTPRDAAGQPAPVTWGSPGAWLGSTDASRSIAHVLRFDISAVDIGHILLGSMRWERDFQYVDGHRAAFDAPGFVPEELPQLIALLERLPSAERTEALGALDAATLDELRARLEPRVSSFEEDTLVGVRVQHVSFDGRNHLQLDLAVDRRRAAIEARDRFVHARSLDGRGVVDVWVRVVTDAAALRSLSRREIFNDAFLQRLARAEIEYDSLSKIAAELQRGTDLTERLLRLRRLERQVRGFELLGYEEKLMAGLPNYATYFGRDMLMTALLMEPVWRPEMFEHVVGSVLRKLSPQGEVSHEEALGGQAIRENAAEANRILETYLALPEPRSGSIADSLLADVVGILEDLQAVRENYVMRDDDFQFPVVAARYLGNPDLSPDRKRAFLSAPARAGGPSRLEALLANLDYVTRTSAAYTTEPAAPNLVEFPRAPDGGWLSASWRDSRAGYGGGRFAMDINVIWVPNALEAAGQILTALRVLGYTLEDLRASAPALRESRLLAYAADPGALEQAVATWRGAARHFEVTFDAAELHERVRAKLAWMPAQERRYWRRVLERTGAAREPLGFLALSLDADGRPIPVASTDPAVALLLENFTEPILRGDRRPEDVDRLLETFTRPYPVGLFVAGLGPLVANDAYASREIWSAYARDTYHGPRTVWGREVNLFLSGTARQIEHAYDASGELHREDLGPYVERLSRALAAVRDAVDASGLKHQELWSYEVDGDSLRPVRYGISTDVQLWNLTDLAVQVQLAQVPQP